MTGARPSETGSRATHRANSSVVSTEGFDPARGCNILDETQQVCPRHGHSHARYARPLGEGLSPPARMASEIEARYRDDRPDRYDASTDPSEGIWELIEDWRASGRRIVRAFAIAAAVFCAVWFAGQLLRAVLS